ncbi:MAG: CoB--CoM heterodisulfide reductase iron-sulfur subunit B family protein [Chloroflexia bacterium]
MTRLAYYPGCTLETTAREYDVSARIASREIGIELVELEGWTCCGASSGHTTQYELSLALPARNLRLAVEQGFDALVAPCAMCYARLRHTVHDLRDPALRARINSLLDAPWEGDVQVHSLVDLFSREENLALLREKRSRDLSGLRPVAYYGCLLVRPPEVLAPDDPEYPTMLDRILQAAGATLVDWPLKTECCGGSISLSCTEIALDLTRKLLEGAVRRGANSIVTACPMCHANLDMRQGQINRRYGTDFHIPIFYFTQIVGLATGHGVKELLLDRHLADPRPLLAEAGIRA